MSLNGAPGLGTGVFGLRTAHVSFVMEKQTRQMRSSSYFQRMKATLQLASEATLSATSFFVRSYERLYGA